MPTHRLIKLRVELLHISPPIWRRIAVPEGIILYGLHLVIQEAFGWTNSHLHDFRVGKQRYASVTDGALENDWVDEPCTDLAEEEFTVGEVLPKKGARMLYTYDFGDNWEHLITHQGPCAEDELEGDVAVLAGARACPPEDCGGVGGYENLVEAMANPKHPEREEFIAWLGEPFEPESFSLGLANHCVKRLMRAMKQRDAARSRRAARQKRRR